MVIVVESGSTKTEWLVGFNVNDCKLIRTSGINPYYQESEEIRAVIDSELTIDINKELVYNVFYYGAGCANAQKNNVIETAIRSVINIGRIEVASDMLGACRGLAGNNPGIVCILGTGSNSCYYDGQRIIDNVSPLGFILGDEGSGANLGKRLVADCLKRQLPSDLTEMFFQRFQTSPSEIIEAVYRQPFPNRYLAGMSRFLAENIHRQECRRIVSESFRSFFERNVSLYNLDRDEIEVNFVGSVAFHYKDILKQEAERAGFRLGRVLQSPLKGMMEYHTR